MTKTPQKRGRRSRWPARYGHGTQPNPRYPKPVWDLFDDREMTPVYIKLIDYPAFKTLIKELAAKYEEP